MSRFKSRSDGGVDQDIDLEEPTDTKVRKGDEFPTIMELFGLDKFDPFHEDNE